MPRKTKAEIEQEFRELRLEHMRLTGQFNHLEEEAAVLRQKASRADEYQGQLHGYRMGLDAAMRVFRTVNPAPVNERAARRFEDLFNEFIDRRVRGTPRSSLHARAQDGDDNTPF